jgi:hypothetical protein
MRREGMTPRANTWFGGVRRGWPGRTEVGTGRNPIGGPLIEVVALSMLFVLLVTTDGGLRASEVLDARRSTRGHKTCPRDLTLHAVV